MHRHRLRLERPRERVRRFEADAESVSRVVRAARARGREQLAELESLRVLERGGIAVDGRVRIRPDASAPRP